MVKIVETRKPSLTLGRRVGVGLGFWAVGLCGVAGGLGVAGATIETKIERFSAEMNGDAPRFETASRLLDRQQTQALVNLATGAAALLVGGRLTRRMELLWSGPVYGSAEAVQLEAAQAETSQAAAAAVPPVVPAEGAVILQFPGSRAA